MRGSAVESELGGLPKGWRWAKLGEVLRQRNDVVHPVDLPVGAARFVGLEHIEAHTGRRLGEVAIRLEKMTGRRARFKKTDIVYGYLRPYLNKVWIAEFDGLCSVDQYVYAVAPELADTEYVAAYLRSGNYLALAPIEETPGQLPRIRTEEVAVTPIPLPPLVEQRRIVSALKERRVVVDAAAAAVSAGVIEVDRIAANSREMLTGDAPSTNLGDVAEIAARLVDPTEADLRILPHINGENIESATGRLLPYRNAEEDKVFSQKFKFDKGDVLYSKLRPYLRKTAIAPSDGLCSADMYPLKTSKERLLPEFLLMELLSDRFTKYAVEESARSRMPKLNRDALFKWTMRLPTLETQRAIVRRARLLSDATATLRLLNCRQLTDLAALEPALLRAAFSGAL